MSHAMKGAVDLGGATGIVTTRKTLGTNPPTSDHDVVIHGSMTVPMKTAVAMGLLDRSVAGAYTSLQPAQAATRTNS